MHSRREVPSAVNLLAQAQSGVVSRQQAVGCGLTPTVIRRLLSDGWWGRLESGIYLIPAVDPSWTGRVWAAVLMGGSDARAGGATAATLHGLADEELLPIEILVPFGVRLADREWVRFRQERVGVRAFSTRAEPARTRIEDTVLDLCADGSEADCISWVTSAVQRRLTTVDDLRKGMGRRARQPHRKLLVSLLSDAASGVHSPLEHRYLHEVERAHRLPDGRRQQPRAGRHEFVDVRYAKYGLVVELDGRVGHLGSGAFRDRRRDNSHTRTGTFTLRYGWHDVTADPCSVALDVAEVLIGLGWDGYPGKCPNCL